MHINDLKTMITDEYNSLCQKLKHQSKQNMQIGKADPLYILYRYTYFIHQYLKCKSITLL